MLDLPGIIEGASSGRGRGRQVIAVAKVRFHAVLFFHPEAYFILDARLLILSSCALRILCTSNVPLTLLPSGTDDARCNKVFHFPRIYLKCQTDLARSQRRQATPDARD